MNDDEPMEWDERRDRAEFIATVVIAACCLAIAAMFIAAGIGGAL